MKYVLAIGLLLLALSVPGVNIYHHVVLPSLNDDKIEESYKVNLEFPFIHKHYDITLNDTIYGTDWYKNIGSVLRSANYGDTVTFHLAGYGGDEATLLLLINQVHMSKAYTTMSVESQVYSAHAYLAVSGDKLVMAPYTWLMFHFSSILSEDCSTKLGKDRGVSNVEHCQALKDTDIVLGKRLVESISILTSCEKERIEGGHDVYLISDEVMKRVNK